MRFMMMVKADENYEAGIPPNDRLRVAIGQLTGEIAGAGSLLEAGGLLPSAQGARVRVADGELMVIDGPFPEINQLIGGYAIVRANSRQEALELGKRFMRVHAEVLGPSYEGELEIRQLAELQPEPAV